MEYSAIIFHAWVKNKCWKAFVWQVLKEGDCLENLGVDAE
jgi:hypothetical protein